MRCVIDSIKWGTFRPEVVTYMLFIYRAVKYLLQPVILKITYCFSCIIGSQDFASQAHTPTVFQNPVNVSVRHCWLLFAPFFISI